MPKTYTIEETQEFLDIVNDPGTTDEQIREIITNPDIPFEVVAQVLKYQELPLRTIVDFFQKYYKPMAKRRSIFDFSLYAVLRNLADEQPNTPKWLKAVIETIISDRLPKQ
jgi:hypothetical protein